MEEELLDRYAECATALEADPNSHALYQQLIEILTRLNLEQELADAYANYAQHLVIPTPQALLRIAFLAQKLDQEPQSHLSLLQFYQESLRNYLCQLIASYHRCTSLTARYDTAIPLLVQYSHHFINNYFAANGIPSPEHPDRTADPVLSAIYSIDSTRTARDNALALGERHLAQVISILPFSLPLLTILRRATNSGTYGETLRSLSSMFVLHSISLTISYSLVSVTARHRVSSHTLAPSRFTHAVPTARISTNKSKNSISPDSKSLISVSRPRRIINSD